MTVTVVSEDSIMDLKADTNLDVRVSMTGPHRISQANKPGYYQRERFSWQGNRWILRFQAAVKERETETTHGVLADRIVTDEPRWVSIVGLREGKPFQSLLRERLDAARKRRGDLLGWSGWSLKRLPTGVHAILDPKGLRPLPKQGRIGSHASFYVEINGTLYWCQFLLREQPEPSKRPVEWERSKGPSAGLPTLGKRR